MGVKKTDEYSKAYDLYCNTELTQKEIAKIVDVSEVQISKWAKENEWKLDKSAKQVTVERLIREYYQQLASMNKIASGQKRNLTTSETDQVIKITNAIEKLRKKHNLQAYHAILRECLEWMMRFDTDKAQLFAPVMLEFLKEKAHNLTNDKSVG